MHPETIKALTIYQPWAGLLVDRQKTYETRSWATQYRGLVAIHAGKHKRLPHEVYQDIALALSIPEDKYDGSWLYYRERGIGTFGAVIGIGLLRACHLVDAEFIASLTPEEQLLGDFTPGRFAWEFNNMKRLATPVKERGQQGLWDWAPPREYGREVKPSIPGGGIVDPNLFQY